MSKEDYYETLGVNKSSSDDEIKQAYRKMAMKYHPDRNKDDKKAEKKFKKVNEAYYILKDKEKKAQYDQFGHQAFENGGAGFKDFNFGGGGFGPSLFFRLGDFLPERLTIRRLRLAKRQPDSEQKKSIQKLHGNIP